MKKLSFIKWNSLRTVVASQGEALTEEGETAQDDVDATEHIVPHGVDRRVVVPVRVDHVPDVLWHKVHHGDTFRIPEDNLTGVGLCMRTGSVGEHHLISSAKVILHNV